MMYERPTPGELMMKKSNPSCVLHFKDLPKDMQNDLIEYINLRFIMTNRINCKDSAYGMKQPFSYFYEWDKGHEEHVTSRCFKEAMEYCGYSSEEIPGKSNGNWHFNAKYRKCQVRRYPVPWTPKNAYLFFPNWKQVEVQKINDFKGED